MTFPINRHQPVQSASCYSHVLKEDRRTLRASEVRDHGQSLRGHGTPFEGRVSVENLDREYQSDLAHARGAGFTTSDLYSSASAPIRFPGSNQPADLVEGVA